MGEIWDNFIAGFSKVEFACYQNKPNWLGWILIIIRNVLACGSTLLKYIDWDTIYKSEK
jgi:hypothetical protein